MPDMPGFEGLSDEPQKNPDTIKTQGYTQDEYEDLLAEASCNADSQWEMEFTEDMTMRYAKYGMGAYLSNNQLEHLQRIAGDD